MPSIAGTNPLTLAEDHARRHVAASATFQQVTKSPSIDAATAHVYIDAPSDPETGDEYGPEELAAIAPFAVVSSPDEQALVLTPIGTHAYDDGGVVHVELWLHAVGSNNREVLRNAKNTIGAILYDLSERAEEWPHLARPTIQLVGVQRIDEDDRANVGDLVIGMARLAWGSQRGED